jgi:hypothetical protein
MWWNDFWNYTRVSLGLMLLMLIIRPEAVVHTFDFFFIKICNKYDAVLRDVWYQNLTGFIFLLCPITVPMVVGFQIRQLIDWLLKRKRKDVMAA